MQFKLLIVQILVLLYMDFGGATSIKMCKQLDGETGKLPQLDNCVHLTLNTSGKHIKEYSSSYEYVHVNGSNEEMFYLHVDRLCYSNSSREQVIVTKCNSLACNPNHTTWITSRSPSCIPKCCPIGSHLDIESGSCNQTTEFLPKHNKFFKAIQAGERMQPNFFTIQIYRVAERISPLFAPNYSPSEQEEFWFKFCSIAKRYKMTTLFAGFRYELVTLVSNPAFETTRQLFCLDLYQPMEASEVQDDNKAKAVAMLCLMDRLIGWQDNMGAYVTTIVFLLLVVAFHCTVLVAHAILWAHQGCYGWTVMVCSGSQMIMGISSVLSWMIWLIAPSVPLLRICGFSALVVNFTFLAAVTWTLLLAYEIWGKINSKYTVDIFGKKRFMIYCLVGFIPPLLILGFKLWNFFSANPLAEFHDACNYFFETLNVYIEVPPVIFLYACILTFGACTLKRLRKIRLARKALTVVTGRQDRPFIRRVKLIWKLMGILGVFYLTDIIFEVCADAKDYRPYYFRSPIKAFGSVLQAFAQFHLFVCSGNTRYHLIKRYPGLQKYLDFFRNVVGCTQCTKKSKHVVPVQEMPSV